MSEQYRALTNEEISQLVMQGCKCQDWGLVRVAEAFDASRVKGTTFGGEVRLGVFDSEVLFYGGVKKPTGISRATIGNCVIGSNVYIDQVKNYIANYVIEDGVIIENVDMLAVEKTSSFGNGTAVSVVNEAGGRKVLIYDELTAQTAYLMAFYRHRPGLIARLSEMVGDYCKKVSSDYGVVGKNARIMNCGSIRDVKIGAFAELEGVSRLERGSVNSKEEEPVFIGPGVSAEDFIFAGGCRITEGTLISRSFIGQGCELAKQYSAENSVFFANCGGYHGEACSIFAGPYTVTHHKSTLLIAGLFSFLNAGSGSNQSNHLYKTGPVHQGIVERGSKTGSNSYMLWPAKVGPFTVIAGRHYSHPDTTDLPFSYLVEQNDESVLVPGLNLCSVGTVRDARKWPTRDRRAGGDKLDLINFKLLSPYTVGRMINGSRILKNLSETSGETADYYTYQGVRIKRSALKRGLELYRTGIDKYVGNCLLKRLFEGNLESKSDFCEVMKSGSKRGRDKWIDAAGLLVPAEVLDELLEGVEKGEVSKLSELRERFKVIEGDFAEYEWSWASGVIEKEFAKSIEEVSVEEVIGLIERWVKAVISIDKMLLSDAKKEFGATARIGYGVDGGEERRKADFAAVRGEFASNGIVLEIEEHIEKKTALAEKAVNLLEGL